MVGEEAQVLPLPSLQEEEGGEAFARSNGASVAPREGGGSKPRKRPPFNPVWLVFRDPTHEKHYSNLIQEDVAKNTLWLSIVGTAAVIVECLITTGFEQFAYPDMVRVVYLMGCLAVICIFAILAVASRCRPCVPHIEYLVVGGVVALTVITTLLCDRWRVTMIVNPESKAEDLWKQEDFADTSLLLGLVALVLSICIFLPIRFFVVSILTFVPSVTFSITNAFLGSPEGRWSVATSTILTFLINCLTIACRWVVEREMRLTFLQLRESSSDNNSSLLISPAELRGMRSGSFASTPNASPYAFTTVEMLFDSLQKAEKNIGQVSDQLSKSGGANQDLSKKLSASIDGIRMAARQLSRIDTLLRVDVNAAVHIGTRQAASQFGLTVDTEGDRGVADESGGGGGGGGGTRTNGGTGTMATRKSTFGIGAFLERGGSSGRPRSRHSSGFLPFPGDTAGGGQEGGDTEPELLESTKSFIAQNFTRSMLEFSWGERERESSSSAARRLLRPDGLSPAVIKAAAGGLPVGSGDSSSAVGKGKGKTADCLTILHPMLLNHARHLLDGQIGINWNADFFEITRQTNNNPLVYAGVHALSPFQSSPLRIPAGPTVAFLADVQSKYLPNPYHNAQHGAEVCHSTLWLARTVGLLARLTAVEELSLIVATLCHDVGHPGRNASFLINARSDLSILYNDAAILENMHSAVTFQSLAQDRCDILRNLSKEETKTFRSNVIKLILETDMSRHFESLSKFRMTRQDPDFALARKDDQMTTALLCIKAADIGHAAKTWHQHYLYSLAVTEEFFAQGDSEKALGIPIGPLCDRRKHLEVARSQAGFLRVVCLEVFKEVALVERMEAKTKSRSFPHSQTAASVAAGALCAATGVRAFQQRVLRKDTPRGAIPAADAMPSPRLNGAAAVGDGSSSDRGDSPLSRRRGAERENGGHAESTPKKRMGLEVHANCVEQLLKNAKRWEAIGEELEAFQQRRLRSLAVSASSSATSANTRREGDGGIPSPVSASGAVLSLAKGGDSGKPSSSKDPSGVGVGGSDPSLRCVTALQLLVDLSAVRMQRDASERRAALGQKPDSQGILVSMACASREWGRAEKRPKLRRPSCGGGFARSSSSLDDGGGSPLAVGGEGDGLVFGHFEDLVEGPLPALNFHPPATPQREAAIRHMTEPPSKYLEQVAAAADAAASASVCLEGSPTVHVEGEREKSGAGLFIRPHPTPTPSQRGGRREGTTGGGNEEAREREQRDRQGSRAVRFQPEQRRGGGDGKPSPSVGSPRQNLPHLTAITTVPTQTGTRGEGRGLSVSQGGLPSACRQTASALELPLRHLTLASSYRSNSRWQTTQSPSPSPCTPFDPFGRWQDGGVGPSLWPSPLPPADRAVGGDPSGTRLLHRAFSDMQHSRRKRNRTRSVPPHSTQAGASAFSLQLFLDEATAARFDARCLEEESWLRSRTSGLEV
uniref:PDEase domain-containing protein n=1 Tax=Chromera velia CCMP2878 TaxID=1169474 RepID=A0A0G4HFS6_9ALVE